LTNEEAATLAAACDQIVPPDDFPGAAAAGVVTFIDRQLATREKENLPTWQKGVRGLDATARQQKGKAFAELSFEEQTAVLKSIEAGEVSADVWEGLDPRGFFDRLVRYTMMGFYGDPRHGGNLRHVSWRMLGVPPAPVRGRLKEVPVASPAAREEG
jgi:gluconate 2-dehydrogenase gamma chain